MKYELTILTKEKAEQNIADFFEDKQYTMTYEGYKRLAYSIEGYEYAHYYYLTLDLTKFEAKLLSEKLNALDWTLRFLLVLEDTKRQHRLIYHTIEEWADQQFGTDGVSAEQIELLTDKLKRELGE